MPTSRGAAMLAVGLAVYGLAWYTHIGWYYFASALLLSVLAVNLPIPWLNTRNLSLKRRAISNNPAELFEDGAVTLEIELYNRSLLPKFLISLNEHCPLTAPGEERQAFLFGIIGPRSRARATYHVSCYKRGVYSFPSLQIYTSAPFGLIRSRRGIEAPLEVTVYPKVLAMESTAGTGHLEGGGNQTGYQAPSGEFRGSREHQLGDDYSNIHWRNSARLAKLMVKEFDQIPRGEVRLAFDTTVVLGDGKHTTLEYSIKIASSLAFRSFQDGRPFRLIIDGREQFFTTWQAVLEHLARLEPGPEAIAQHFLNPRQQLNPTAVTAVIVSAADAKSLAMLQSNPASLVRTTVMLLTGFGNEENPHSQHDLGRAGVDVLLCRAGDLDGALESLSSRMQMAVYNRAGHR